MTKVKTRKTKSLACEVKMLPIADMHVSKLNMRYGKNSPNIDDIYPSVLDKGINQSMLVRKEGKGWGVIAGRRRLFALKKKAKETGAAQIAPCIVMESGNAKSAREASLLENIARVPATMLEQFGAYKGLADSGKDVDEIAQVFAIPAKSVRRVLALANLLPEILSLFDDDKIRQPTLEALTLATPDQQAKWLELFHGETYAPQGHNLKEWLTGGAQISTECALFNVADFDGTIITDLFGETDYFADPDAFWPLQNAAIATAVSEWKEQGWTEIVVLERGTRFDRYEHGQRSQEQGGKIYIATGHDGTVTPNIGFMPKSDIKKIDAILGVDNGEGSSKSKSSKPEMSGPLKEYVALHRHAAIRASLLGHPKAALRLTVAHMFAGSYLWSVAPQPTKSRKEATTISIANSKGAVIFEAERKAVYELLGVKPFDHPYSPSKHLAEGSVAQIFARLLELGDAAVMRVMALAMCESLTKDADIIEAVTYAVPVDMTALWEPDDAFFDILRDKAVINAMVKDIAGKRAADANLTETGKVQKAIIRDCLDVKGSREARPDWRPKWMQVPATHYIDKATCPPASECASLSKVMVTDEKKETDKAA
ncbi:ParB/RepB/Spo0J family partition protein [Robiginitomaculum antarcticum]|uniref:ParB/RepB/Spo0J family partition protein n=1 Tax=Robiginitomaculum antarcticum TaxID=437507 RepID=UPI00036AB7ED|nr:ParB N-terminal domain-containing protein [Robiginitomaculum antarcticum]